MSYPVFGNSTELEITGGPYLEQPKIKLLFDSTLNSWEPLDHLNAGIQILALIIDSALGSVIQLLYLSYYCSVGLDH